MLLIKKLLHIVDLQYCVLGVQQSESVTHIHIPLLFFFRSFSHIVHYRELSSVLCVNAVGTY